MKWSISCKTINNDNGMPNCCDEGNGICGECSCCNQLVCVACETIHEGSYENCPPNDQNTTMEPIKHYKFINGEYVEQKDESSR